MIRRVITVTLLWLVAAVACSDGPAPPREEPGSLAEGGLAGAPELEPLPQLEPPSLAAVPTEPVQGRTGPGGVPFHVAVRTAELPVHLHRRIGPGTYETALRTFGLKEYPCSSCHAPGTEPVTPEGVTDPHESVRRVHPAETGVSCASCHAVDDVERLVLHSGETVTLQHAYRICAQCHFQQTDAWAGGAHGKRLDGWRGRRVVMNCTDCHDPHRPALEKRIPFPGPRIPRTGREEP